MKSTFEVTICQTQSKQALRKVISPPKLWGHTLNYYRGYLFLYGGNNKSSFSRDSDLYSIDAKNLGQSEWTLIIPDDFKGEEEGIMPESRDTHTANIISHKLYIVCGSKDGEKCSEI